MAEAIIIGGPGVAVFWARTSNAAGAVIKKMAITNSTTLTRDSTTGIWTITWDQEEDSAAFQAFLDAANPPGATTSTTPERKREGGRIVGGGASSGTSYVLAITGNEDLEGTGTTRKVWLGNVKVDPGSGAYGQKADEPTKPALIVKSYSESVATTVALATLNAVTAEDGTTVLYAAAADLTIPANSPGKAFFPVAA